MFRYSLLLLSLLAGAFCTPCIFSNANYHVTYGIRGSTVHFRLAVTGLPPNFNGWTGVGFGQSMGSGLDAVIVRLFNGRVFVTDEYVQGYTTPQPDRNSNILVHSTSFNNGILIASFSRSVGAFEPFDRTIKGCQTWQFIVGLNRMSPQGSLYHHSQRPIARTVCVDQCTV